MFPEEMRWKAVQAAKEGRIEEYVGVADASCSGGGGGRTSTDCGTWDKQIQYEGSLIQAAQDAYNSVLNNIPEAIKKCEEIHYGTSDSGGSSSVAPPASAFASTSTPTSGFGNITTTPAATSAFGSGGTSSAFGGSTTFGSSPFGAPTSTTGAFGSGGPSAFGQSAFGGSAASATNPFGSAPTASSTTTSSAFGSGSGKDTGGQPFGQSAFGQAVGVAPTSSTSGQNAPATTSGFGGEHGWFGNHLDDRPEEADRAMSPICTFVAPATAASASSLSSIHIWDTFLPKALQTLALLPETVRAAFTADRFEMGRIPIVPPPVDCR